MLGDQLDLVRGEGIELGRRDARQQATGVDDDLTGADAGIAADLNRRGRTEAQSPGDRRLSCASTRRV